MSYSLSSDTSPTSAAAFFSPLFWKALCRNYVKYVPFVIYDHLEKASLFPWNKAPWKSIWVSIVTAFTYLPCIQNCTVCLHLLISSTWGSRVQPGSGLQLSVCHQFNLTARELQYINITPLTTSRVHGKWVWDRHPILVLITLGSLPCRIPETNLGVCQAGSISTINSSGYTPSTSV